MKTLQDFKNRLKPGIKLHTIYHQAFAGRNEQNNYLLKDEDKGVRKVSLVMSKQLALETVRTDGKIVDSYCEYPKASQVKIIDDNTIQILSEDFRNIQDGGTGGLIPVLTYTFIE